MHCLKDKQPCVQGRERLQTQLSILEEPQVDPFQASESDIEDAYGPDQLLDPDEEGDEDDDVDICYFFTEKQLFCLKHFVFE